RIGSSTRCAASTAWSTTSPRSHRGRWSGSRPPTMRVLIVGSGAREHALAWSAARSHGVSEVIVAPGNGGTARAFRNVDVDPMDMAALTAVARDERADLVIVGSDDPLAAGAVDALEAADFLAFGPTKAAAQIEWSKV